MKTLWRLTLAPLATAAVKAARRRAFRLRGLAVAEEVTALLYEAGITAYVGGGLLLGLLRDGWPIPGDEDIDLMVSDQADPMKVRHILSRIGRLRRMYLVGGRVMEQGYSIRGVWVDVFYTDDRNGVTTLPIFWGERAGGQVEFGWYEWPWEVVPERRGNLIFPGKTDQYLAEQYGPGWRTPAPGYGYMDASNLAKPGQTGYVLRMRRRG